MSKLDKLRFGINKLSSKRSKHTIASKNFLYPLTHSLSSLSPLCTMSLSKLNQDCFFAVLGYTPLSKQLHFRLVSSHWLASIESQLRHRRSLSVLNHKYDWVYKRAIGPKFQLLPLSASYAIHDPLYLSSSLSSHTPAFTFLSRLLPKVTQLLVLFPDLCPLSLNPYIRLLSGSLTSLGIYKYDALDWSLLVAPASSLKHLYHLFPLFDSVDYGSPYAAVLRQIASFGCCTFNLDHLPLFGPSIRRLYIGEISSSHYESYLFRRGFLPLEPVICPASHTLQHLAMGGFSHGHPRRRRLLKCLFLSFTNLKSVQYYSRWVSRTV